MPGKYPDYKVMVVEKRANAGGVKRRTVVGVAWEKTSSINGKKFISIQLGPGVVLNGNRDDQWISLFPFSEDERAAPDVNRYIHDEDIPF